MFVTCLPQTFLREHDYVIRGNNRDNENSLYLLLFFNW